MRPALVLALLAAVLLGAVLLGGLPPTVASLPAAAPTVPRVDPTRVAILLIDAQPSFWKIMAGEREPVEARIEQLLLGGHWWQVPVVATFEADTERNGWLPERLETVFPEHGKRIVKRFFDCCREPDVAAELDRLRAAGIAQIAIAGAETDVCVLQSVLGLRERGFEVFVLEDCLFTAEPNVGPAIARMRQAGAVPSTFKTFYCEMMKGVKGVGRRDEWRDEPPAVKDRVRNPYALPPSPIGR